MTVNYVGEIIVVIVTYNNALCISTLSRSFSNLKNIIFVDNTSAYKTMTPIRKFISQEKNNFNRKISWIWSSKKHSTSIIKIISFTFLNQAC